MKRKIGEKRMLGKKPKRAAQAKIRAKKPCQVKNSKGRSKQKLREKTMGMAKIPKRTSWAKITWHRRKKKKNKDNKQR